MTTPLIDLRAKITIRTNQVLEAHSRANKLDKAEIVRMVLDDWAKAQIHTSDLVHRLTRGEGLTGE